MSLVSIIIPYYKKRFYIAEAINSAINQTYRKLEIIIIYDDPGNSDLYYLKQISKKDRRIKLIINNINQGAGNSRNIGINESRGEYIAFLDSDDLWSRNKIELQLKFMNENNSIISHTTYKVLQKNLKYQIRKAKNFEKLSDLLKSCDIGLSTIVIEKKIIKKKYLFPNLITKEDYVLWLKISRDLSDIHGLQEILTMWRNSKNSLSSNFFQKMLDGFRVYNVYMNFNWVKSLYYLLVLSFNYMKKSK